MVLHLVFSGATMKIKHGLLSVFLVHALWSGAAVDKSVCDGFLLSTLCPMRDS